MSQGSQGYEKSCGTIDETLDCLVDFTVVERFSRGKVAGDTGRSTLASGGFVTGFGAGGQDCFACGADFFNRWAEG